MKNLLIEGIKQQPEVKVILSKVKVPKFFPKNYDVLII